MNIIARGAKKDMKKLNLKSKLKKAANVLAGIFTFATVAGGISALATTVVNPVDLWWSIAPIEIAYFNYIITYTISFKSKY